MDPEKLVCMNPTCMSVCTCVFTYIYATVCKDQHCRIHALYILSKDQNLKLRFNMYHGRLFGKPLPNVLINRLPNRCLSMCEVVSALWFIKFRGSSHSLQGLGFATHRLLSKRLTSQ